MSTEILILSVIGGFIALDTTAAFQVLIAHPLVGCAAAGIVLHDISLGLTIGIILELPWLLEIPVGGARYPEGNVGSFVAAAVAILVGRYTGRSEASLFLALLWGLAFSLVTGKAVDLVRRCNVALIHAADRAGSAGNSGKISLYHLLGVGQIFIMGVFITAVAVYMGVKVLPILLSALPSGLDKIFDYTKPAALGVGAGVMAKLFLSKRTYLAATIGLLLGILVLRIV